MPAVPRAAKATRRRPSAAASGRFQASSEAAVGRAWVALERRARAARRRSRRRLRPGSPRRRSRPRLACSAYPSAARATRRPRRADWIARARSRSRSSCVFPPGSRPRALVSCSTRATASVAPVGGRRIGARHAVVAHGRVGRGQHLVPALERSGRRQQQVRLASERAVEGGQAHDDGVPGERALQLRPGQGAAVVRAVEEQEPHRAGGHVLESSLPDQQALAVRPRQRATRDEAAATPHAAEGDVQQRDRTLRVGRERPGARLAAADRDRRRLHHESAAERLDPSSLESRARGHPLRREVRDGGAQAFAARAARARPARRARGRAPAPPRRRERAAPTRPRERRSASATSRPAPPAARRGRRASDPAAPIPRAPGRRSSAACARARGRGRAARASTSACSSTLWVSPSPRRRRVDAARQLGQQPVPGRGHDAPRAPVEHHHLQAASRAPPPRPRRCGRPPRRGRAARAVRSTRRAGAVSRSG